MLTLTQLDMSTLVANSEVSPILTDNGSWSKLSMSEAGQASTSLIVKSIGDLRTQTLCHPRQQEAHTIEKVKCGPPWSSRIKDWPL